MTLPNSSYPQDMIEDYLRELRVRRPDCATSRLVTICIDFAIAGWWSHEEAWQIINFAVSRDIAGDPLLEQRAASSSGFGSHFTEESR